MLMKFVGIAATLILVGGCTSISYKPSLSLGPSPGRFTERCRSTRSGTKVRHVTRGGRWAAPRRRSQAPWQGISLQRSRTRC